MDMRAMASCHDADRPMLTATGAIAVMTGATQGRSAAAPPWAVTSTHIVLPRLRSRPQSQRGSLALVLVQLAARRPAERLRGSHDATGRDERHATHTNPYTALTTATTETGRSTMGGHAPLWPLRWLAWRECLYRLDGEAVRALWAAWVASCSWRLRTSSRTQAGMSSDRSPTSLL
jgi:hypothetical protein